MNLLHAKATEIVSSVKSKKISAFEVASFFLNRVKKLNPELNALISINDNILEDAKILDKKIEKGEDTGILAGLPIAIKDLICTEGIKTTAASKMLDDFVPTYSASLVKKLEDQGALIIGKANLDEFAMGSSNETSFYGVSKNPWDKTKVPGGSSGGSAVAVAARLCPVAIGTDTGGSIRQPASFCGISGIKPTYGRVSRFGIIAFASSLDQAGPMGTYAEDCALVLEAISGIDKFDATTADEKVPNFRKSLSENKKMKIGLPKQYFGEGLSESVKSVVNKKIDYLKTQGHELIDVDLPLTEYAVATYYVVASAEASSNLSRYDGVRFGHRSKKSATLDDLYKNSRGEAFGPEVKRRIMLGTYALSSGYYDAYYSKALKLRQKLQEDFNSIFENCDLILAPVTTDTAFDIGSKINDPLSMYLNDIFTISSNLAGLPAMSIPAGFDKAGLPVGIQLMAPHFKETNIFELAGELEKSVLEEGRRPDVF